MIDRHNNTSVEAVKRKNIELTKTVKATVG